MAVIEIIDICPLCFKQFIEPDVCEERFAHISNTFACEECGCECDPYSARAWGRMTAEELRAEFADDETETGGGRLEPAPPSKSRDTGPIAGLA